ncbi:MAG: alpha/beta fold hydrolase [Pseudomonadota bacterium]
MQTLTLALMIGSLGTHVLADPAALHLTQLDLPHHGHGTNMSVWYPSVGGGDTTVFGENGVFKGVEALMGASPRPGTHPVVVFSHGMGGTFRAQSWLAAGLAQRGAIVVGVDHPNTSWNDFDMAEGVKHWTRTADLSAALDAVMVDPVFADHIDPTRIMAAGFSYGGWTALSMGGMTGNHAGIVAACTDNIDRMEACDMLLSDAVNMQGLDPDTWNASYADSRISHVAAIDPGFVWGLTAANTAGLVPDTMMIGFGSDADRMSATDFDASGLSELLPGAQITQFDPAFHFTAMPLCKPEGPAILEAENDDPVCTDPPGTDRAAVHAAIIDALADQLGL